MIGGFRKAETLKKIMDTIDRNEIYTRNHRIKLKNTEVYCSNIDYLSGKLIIVFDPSMESLKKYHTTPLAVEDVIKNTMTRIQLRGHSSFRWEKMVTQSAIQNKIMDVVIKKT